MKPKRTGQKGLLGKPIPKRKSRYQVLLEKYDRENLDERIQRLKWIESFFPKDYGFAMSPEKAYVFDEAKMTFISGELGWQTFKIRLNTKRCHP